MSAPLPVGTKRPRAAVGGENSGQSHDKKKTRPSIVKDNQVIPDGGGDGGGWGGGHGGGGGGGAIERGEYSMQGNGDGGDSGGGGGGRDEADAGRMDNKQRPATYTRTMAEDAVGLLGKLEKRLLEEPRPVPGVSRAFTDLSPDEVLVVHKKYKQFARNKEMEDWSHRMSKALDLEGKWKPGWKGKLVLVCYSGPNDEKAFHKFFIEVLAPANGALLTMMQDLTNVALRGEKSELKRAWEDAADRYTQVWGGDHKPGDTSTDGGFRIKDWQDVKPTLEKKVRSLVVVLGGESGGMVVMVCMCLLY